MNYYPFHIGDFRSGTVNMGRLARWIYRDMLDVYYDKEQPLPLDLDKLCDLLGVESDDERRMVERVLRLKFVAGEDGYRNAICDQVIAEYHKKAETARANGGKGGRPKKSKPNPEQPSGNTEKPSGFQSGSNQDANGNPVATGSQANQEPITNNQNGADDDSTVSGSEVSSVPPGFDEGGFAVPKEAPLPMREQPPLSEDPAVVLSVKLRRLGVNVMSTNPHLLQWLAEGATFEQLAEAVTVARENKPEPEKIAPGYLVPILQKLRNPDPARPGVSGKALNDKFNFGHLDRSGDQRVMEEGIKRLGITVPGNNEEIDI